MIRWSLLTVLLYTLSACGEYREPRASCFNFVASAENEESCAFFKLGWPESSLVVND